MAALLVALVVIAIPLLSRTQAPTLSLTSDTIDVLVTKVPGFGAQPEETVARLGGRVAYRPNLVDRFYASVPETALRELKSSPGVSSLTLTSKMDAISGYPSPDSP